MRSPKLAIIIHVREVLFKSGLPPHNPRPALTAVKKVQLDNTLIWGAHAPDFVERFMVYVLGTTQTKRGTRGNKARGEAPESRIL